jgi:mRNA deadenylase 3'-5' endonuclease subunit Ccr4
MSWAALRSCVGKGKSLIKPWVRLKSKSRQNSLVLVSAYVRPISTRSQAEFADDLSALTVDIEHWQQKNTVVVCGDFNARIGRQVESQLSSPSVRRDHAGRSRSYASGSHEHNRAVQFGKQKGETRYTCIRTQGQSVVDYLMGPASFLKFTTSVALHRGR